MNIGVLAIQGDVREHVGHIHRLGADTTEVRRAEEIDELDGLVLPGGESTTIGLLMEETGVLAAVRNRYQIRPFPIWGTCAGLILLAEKVNGPRVAGLELMHIVADRNAYGRQVASFETALAIPAIGPKPFPAVFIRAPKISRVGPGVTPLATYQDQVVMAEEGSLMVSAFHPEMSGDLRVHQYFLQKVAKHLAIN